MKSNPYRSLPPEAFWKSAVAARHACDITGLAQAKRKVGPADVVATAGSCFAQHISRALKGAGFNFLDAEPPLRGLDPRNHAAFGYGQFSARYGNIYTSSQLLQLMLRCLGRFQPAETIWADGDRFYDPFRPSIEPKGFATRAEAEMSQKAHLEAVRRMFRRANVFIFTLGLTETWMSREDKAVYPTCPGTQAGTFDPDKHAFLNLTYDDVMSDMRRFVTLLGSLNRDVRIILTVSPVPLTATASGQHVLVATTHSKSVLRAAAGQLATEFPNVDYFPSYEIITSPVFSGFFFEPNRREVHKAGVDFVMKTFLREFCEEHAAPPLQAPAVEKDQEDVWCDERMLEAFAQ